MTYQSDYQILGYQTFQKFTISRLFIWVTGSIQK